MSLTPPPARPTGPGTPRTGPVHSGDLDDPRLRYRLADAVQAVDAYDTVFAYSRAGRRAVCAGGDGPPTPVARERLRYEVGSATKTATVLLLARLHHEGRLSWLDPALTHLTPRHPLGDRPATLLHLATHTSGLPRLPPDLYPAVITDRCTNPYAGYPAARLVAAFVRASARPRHRPGARWRYSNFGAAVLGQALAAGSDTDWNTLLAGHILTPLGMSDSGTRPSGPGTDAVGHRKDGRTPVPPLLAAGFSPAGALRATPHDLLTYLEAHLHPERHGPGALADALRAVRQPMLRRGLGHRHIHSATWFVTPTRHGVAYSHGGATCGQQAFLGFRPETDTAVVGLTTRRFTARDPFMATALTLLTDPP
ncbi:beta-lactamase family protein [Streptomyces sp. OF8]|uniref:Beta-lactamase family protein n=2 Tax=Streptomyces alkaliterrae TaxID=2213162 RepID=A0A7W3WX11_9ACTN|nr:beta-lactamase family protein [Streptomyces alkaliterrae]